MDNQTQIKNATFWQASILFQGRKSPVVANWNKILEPVASSTRIELTHESIVYDLHLNNYVFPVLGVHKVLNTAFMSRLGETEITDLMDELDQNDAHRFAYSTAITFLPVAGVIAVATGSSQSPKPAKVITDFLATHVSQGEGKFWAVDPLMDRDKIARLRDYARGVVSLSTRIDTANTLFKPDPNDGIAKYTEQLKQRIGADVVVELKVSIPREHRTRTASQKFKDLVLVDIPRIVYDKGSKTAVQAIFPDGIEDITEHLNLVARRFAVEFSIPLSETESQSFTNLTNHLVELCKEVEPEIRSLVGSSV